MGNFRRKMILFESMNFRKSGKQKCKRSFPHFANVSIEFLSSAVTLLVANPQLQNSGKCLLFISPIFRFYVYSYNFILASVEFKFIFFYSFSHRHWGDFPVHIPSFTVHGKLQLSSGQAIRQPTDGPTENCDESHWPSQSDRLTDRLTDQQIYVQTEFDRANKQNDILTRQ